MQIRAEFDATQWDVEYELIIRGGMVSLPSGSAAADIGVREGRIAAIGDLRSHEALESVDARGLLVLPGVIDTQVHFREPGLEHKEDIESGTRAAITGGVTAILEMPNTIPTTTDAESLSFKLRRANGRAWCDYGFFVGATKENVSELGELELLPGTPGVKIFMGSSTGSLLVDRDEDLTAVLRACRRRCPIHAEDEARNALRKSLISQTPDPSEHPFLRDAESARLATERILRISAETRHPVHILHVSTLEEPSMIAAAKREGLGTTAEVTPQHLYFQAPECYQELGTRAQMNPPIRNLAHQEGLWRALDAGVFDVFGSDHAPHTLEEKSQPYPKSPSGMPGVQTLLPVLLTFVAQGRLTLARLVQMASQRPAELYGIRGKGRIQEGFDADFALVDPNRRYRFERSMVQSKCGWSPYEGETLIGSIEHVVLAGSVVVRDGELQGFARGKMLQFDAAS